MMRILCVEDNEDSREMITILLRKEGFEMVTASSVYDGLELSRRGGFDLIILDNWYEQGSGVELCKQIRRFDMQTPIIFYSGAAYPADEQQAMDAGAQDYLIKPLGIGNMVKTIERLTRLTNRPSKLQ